MKGSGKKAPFNPALKGLKLKVESRDEAPVDNVSTRGPSQSGNGSLPEDSRVFLEAMAGVEPLSRRDDKACRTEPPFPKPSHPPPDEERAAVEELKSLVRGSIEMDISFTDEYMEGAVSGIGRKTMKRLKQGRFPIQDHIDLHGLTRDEARDRVREFLIRSHKTGLRCVLIVHGRGHNSPYSFPVLKEQLPVWLNQGPARRIVLAFVTARPYDGGAGALYILLRHR